MSVYRKSKYLARIYLLSLKCNMINMAVLHTISISSLHGDWKTSYTSSYETSSKKMPFIHQRDY